MERSIAIPRGRRRRSAPGRPAAHEGDHTTHFSVVDKDGNAVANTYTLNFFAGMGAVAEATGVLLNNELDDFAAAPNTPNAYGLLGGTANAPGPRKRPLSSMSPTIVVRDGKPFLVTGAAGGSRIITAVLQTTVNAIDFGMDVGAAVAAPRVHHQWLPDEVSAEVGVAPAVVDALRAAAPQGGARRCRAFGELDHGDEGRLGRCRRSALGRTGRRVLGLPCRRSQIAQRALRASSKMQGR